MNGKILTKVSHHGNKQWVWIWQPLPSKLNRICKAKGETQKEVVKNGTILLPLIFNVFFFLDRPLCCHESLGGRYQIIAFEVRITQHIISKIPLVLGYPVVLKCLLFSKRFFVACVQTPPPLRSGRGASVHRLRFLSCVCIFCAILNNKITIFTSYPQIAITCITLVHKIQQSDFTMSKAGRYLSSAKE